jgi:hypothetical protein
MILTAPYCCGAGVGAGVAGAGATGAVVGGGVVITGGVPPAPVVPVVPVSVPVVVVVPGVGSFTCGERVGVSSMMPRRMRPTTIRTPAMVPPVERDVRVVGVAVVSVRLVFRPEVVRRSSGRGDRSAMRST